MSTPGVHSDFGIRPKGPGALLVEKDGVRYEFIRPLLEHEDFEPVALARRRRIGETGPGELVLLRRVVHPPVAERLQRATEELRVAACLRHPNIARVYELVEQEAQCLLVAEYLPGCYLGTAMDAGLLKGSHLSWPFMAYVAAQVAEALHYAYHCRDEAGQPLKVVHRAISPLCIRLGREGEVKLEDFGVARSEVLARLPTRSRTLRADLSYAAPEVFLFGAVDGRADLYSLGMVLLEGLTGLHPLDPPDVDAPPRESVGGRYASGVQAERESWASAQELAERSAAFGPERVEWLARDLPEPLKQVVSRALCRNREERYPTGREMAAALREWLGDLSQPFGREEAAKELAPLLSAKPSPHRMQAFPTEPWVLLTPEEEAWYEEQAQHLPRL